MLGKPSSPENNNCCNEEENEVDKNIIEKDYKVNNYKYIKILWGIYY